MSKSKGPYLTAMPYERKTYSVYIMGSLSGTLYIGVTSNLHKRAFEHKFHRIEGFTDNYDIERLLYWESFDDVHKAIAREKQPKGWRRSKKIALIESVNPHWLDLAREWYPSMENPGGRGASTPQGDPQADRPAPLSMTMKKDCKKEPCHAERSEAPAERSRSTLPDLQLLVFLHPQPDNAHIHNFSSIHSNCYLSISPLHPSQSKGDPP